MKKFFKAITKNYKTSLAGIAVLTATAYRVSVDPLALLDPMTLTMATTGLGLLVAKDGDQAGLPTVSVKIPETPGK